VVGKWPAEGGHEKKQIKWRFVAKKGGSGSGDFGHSGRPGEVGGSSGGHGYNPKNDLTDEERARKRQHSQQQRQFVEGVTGGGKDVPEGRRMTIPTFSEISRHTGDEGIAYIVHGALKNALRHGGPDPVKAFTDSVDDQNYYGSKKWIVFARKKALDVYRSYLKKFDVGFDESKYNKYESAQFDED
jgi:hypothetical protein